MRAPDPAWHRCSIGELDYSLVDNGVIRCALERGGCGRTWTFLDPNVHDGPGVGWRPSPRPVEPLRRGARRIAPAVPSSGGQGPW